jgi:anti-sigma factor RsiW
MNCDWCQTRVDDYVEGKLPRNEQNAMKAHLADCAACRAVADDFRAIRSVASRLERHVPPASAWTNIAAAIEREPRRSYLGFAGPIIGSGSRPGALAIAATLLLLVGGTSWFVWTRVSAPAPATERRASQAPAVDPELTQTVETELKLAEEHYQKAIAGLEQITRSESAALDPQVAAVLKKNLEVIDQAIGESRSALGTQPTSDVAQESLFEALRNKVSLLQETVVLINEMRKGNQEGTARIVSGLNQ